MFSRILEIMTKVMENSSEIFDFITSPIHILGFQIDLFDIFTVAGLTAFLIVVIPRFFSD